MELNEADLIERYGWTYEQLDNSDEDRVYLGIGLQNMRESIRRIKDWLRHVGKYEMDQRDMDLYGMMLDAEKELLEDRDNG